MQRLQNRELGADGPMDYQSAEQDRPNSWMHEKAVGHPNEGSSTDKPSGNTAKQEWERTRTTGRPDTQGERKRKQRSETNKSLGREEYDPTGSQTEIQEQRLEVSRRRSAEQGDAQIEWISTQELTKDTWKPSQQSGFQGELTLTQGVKGSPQLIPLQLKWVKSYFSEEEEEFFMAAATESKISQTHYTNPDAEMFYRCPICAKVLNPSGLSKHTTRHFLRMHNAPNREYLVTLHEDPKKQIRIRTSGNMARRSGAGPPPLSQIQDQEAQAKSRQNMGTEKAQIGILKSKQKQKGRPTKKKRR